MDGDSDVANRRYAVRHARHGERLQQLVFVTTPKAMAMRRSPWARRVDEVSACAPTRNDCHR
jgi:hypothetical protein